MIVDFAFVGVTAGEVAGPADDTKCENTDADESKQDVGLVTSYPRPTHVSTFVVVELVGIAICVSGVTPCTL